MGDKQNTYKEINEKYAQKLDAYIRKRDSLRERIIDLKSRIEKLEKQEMRMPYPHYISFLLKPIAKELLKDFSGYTSEIYGPFGMRNTTSIHFVKYSKSKKDGKRIIDDRFSLTFSPSSYNDHKIYVWNGKRTGEIKNYSEDLNNFTMESVPVESFEQLKTILHETADKKKVSGLS